MEFDKDKLIAALRSGLDPNDCKPNELNDLLADYQEELIDEVDDVETTLNLSSIGGTYKIGPLDITCVLGNLVLLSSIDSPILSEELKAGDTLEFDDCVQAIYVLALGKEAIEPIMAIKQRIKDLLLLKPLVKNNPEMMDKIIKKAEEISKGRIVFADKARKFWKEEFEGYNFEEIINQMITAITDVLIASKNLPTEQPKGGNIIGGKKN